MPFEIIRQDITKMQVDAVVNAANNSLLGGGGVDGAIHRAAGPELLEECRTLNGCETGQAKITKGYNLPAKYVIHTVGPVWHGGNNREAELLASCYRNSLALAKEYKCESIAFPMISTGAYGYPKDDALQIAVGVISSFLMENDMLVYLVVFGKESLTSGKKPFREVQEYIDDVYAEEHGDNYYERRRRQSILGREYHSPARRRDAALEETSWNMDSWDMESAELKSAAPAPAPCAGAGPDLEELLRRQDEGFSKTLLRLIRERGMTESACYHRANIDRRLFSKIKSDPEYRPGKPTVFAFAVALGLDLKETEDFLRTAGFAISNSSVFDIILRFFIERQRYDIYEINEVLFENDQPLLGSGMN